MILFISLCALTFCLTACSGELSSCKCRTTAIGIKDRFLSSSESGQFLREGTQFRFDYTYHHGAKGWLKLHRIPATWKDAYLTCHYEGAVLASPANETMRLALKDAIADRKSGQSLQSLGIFTGIHATFGKGAYFSVEGIPLSRMPVTWAPGEPNNAGNAEDCLLMLPNGTLADVSCSEVHPYVCYRKKQINAPVLNACGTVDNGYKYDNRTGSCYKFHTDPLNWTRAFVACAHEGGHLAVINSKLELELIQELYSESYSSLVPGIYNRNIIFLGFRNFENHLLWMTIHGQTLKEAGYDGWNEGQPDRTDQHCGALFKDGLLDDSFCWDIFPFVCEKHPASLLNDEEL